MDDKERDWEQLRDMGLDKTLHGILVSSSKEREEVRRSGSQPGKAANNERECELKAELLHLLYFAPVPLLDEFSFRRRYCVSRLVCNKLKEK